MQAQKASTNFLKVDAPALAEIDIPEGPSLDTYLSQEKEQFVSEGILLLFGLTIFALFVVKLAKRRDVAFMDLPLVATLAGITCGSVLKFLFHETTVLQRVLAFRPEIFFLLLLPPIVFQSGFGFSGLRARSCAENAAPILALILLTTSLSILFVAFTTRLCSVAGWLGGTVFSTREALAFGALISTTDPVSVLSLFREVPAHPVVDALVSGESLLNDAVSLMVYRAITDSRTVSEPVVDLILFIVGAAVVGAALGLTVAAACNMFETENEQSNFTLIMALMVLCPWIAYLIPDCLGMSGIVSSLFCGITIARYTSPVHSPTLRLVSAAISATLASLSETIVFILLGLGVFSFKQSQASLGLVVCTSAIVLCARLFSVDLTCRFVNFASQSCPIPQNFKWTLILSGFRGAVGLSLAVQARHDFGGKTGSAILSATLCCVVSTTLVLSIALRPMLRRLDIFVSNREVENKREMSAQSLEMGTQGGSTCPLPQSSPSTHPDNLGIVTRNKIAYLAILADR